MSCLIAVISLVEDMRHLIAFQLKKDEDFWSSFWTVIGVIEQIKAGDKSATCPYSITSYRNSFYGTITTKVEPTSDIIRSLNKSNKALSNGEGFDVEVPVGAIRVIIAYPAYLDDLIAVKDNNDSMSNIISSFIKTTVPVKDASGTNEIDYKVYYIDYANPNDAKNVYSVII